MTAARRLLALLLAGALAAPLPAAAQAERRIGLVRDAEAETLIRDYARPILKAAGLSPSAIQVKIASDQTFNAFVADQRHIFINAGTIIQSQTPNELMGVIAHETGHLAGGHLVRLREAVIEAQILSALGIIGGAAAAIASDSSQGSQAGVAAALGGLQIGQRSMLAYARSEESAADRAAVTYLEATGQSGQGMLDTFARLADQQLFGSSFSDPYVLSHPMAADRLSAIEETVRASRFYGQPDDPALVARHDLVRAKFLAFTASANTVQRTYPAGDDSLPAAYARAIVAFRFADPASAVAATDALIERQPGNPYFWELKGQILLETGNPKAAVAPLRKAVALAPKEGLIRVLLGRALVGAEDDGLLKEAIAELTRGLGDDPDQAIGYRQLAIAHARSGNIGMADLATAQGAFAAGDIKAAKQMAERAQRNLKTGTPAWLRADDILTYKPPR